MKTSVVPSILLSAAAFAVLPQLSAQTAPAPSYLETAMHATFKLFNESSTATCFLLKDPATGEIYLVTSAHVLGMAMGEKSILVLRKPDADGKYERSDHPIAIREGKKDLWTEHPEHDIAAMRLSFPEGVPEENATLSLNALEASGLAYGGKTMVLSYPARFESSPAGFPVARQGVVASFPVYPEEDHPVFLIDFTAWSGDSGGPVLLERDGEPVIAGLVTSKIDDNETIESATESRKIKHSLGLGKAVHSSLILETIRRISAASPDAEEAPAADVP